MAVFIKIINDKEYDDWVKSVNPNTFKLYYHLLVKAKPVTGVYKKNRVLKRGQLDSGRKQLAGEIGVTESAVRNSLSQLVKSGKLIERAVGKEYTVYTLPYYNKHNGFSGNELELITDDILDAKQLQTLPNEDIINDQDNDQGLPEIITCESTTSEALDINNDQDYDLQTDLTTKVTTKETNNYDQDYDQGARLTTYSESNTSTTSGTSSDQGNDQGSKDLRPRERPILYNSIEGIEVKNINTITPSESTDEKDFYKNFPRPESFPGWPEAVGDFMKTYTYFRDELLAEFPELVNEAGLKTRMKYWVISQNELAKTDKRAYKNSPGLREHFKRAIRKHKKENRKIDGWYTSATKPTAQPKYKSEAFIEVDKDYEDHLLEGVNHNQEKKEGNNLDYLFAAGIKGKKY